MLRMSGESAGFLSLELAHQPMNVVVVALLAPGVAIDLDFLRGHVGWRLGELPALRWRVVPVPLGLHHPVLVEDPGFDLGYHLRQTSLPAPGTAEQLDRFCASLAEQSLDRRYPLWQLVLVDGLDGGGQAVILRIHHCLMDGFATICALSCLFSGEDYEAHPPAIPWHPEIVPRRGRLVLDALADHARGARRLPALVRATRRNWSAANAAKSDSIVVPAQGRDTPASSINRAFTVERRYVRTALALADVKRVKAAAGVSVNDVALALVAGSLRRYLVTRDDLPATALLASVPVGLEAPDAPPRTFGNRFSALTTSLATDVADPWQRLETIAAVTAESKRLLAIFGREMLPDWLEYLPPAIVTPLLRHGERRRRKHQGRAGVNVVVSNVRGPAAPWRLGPATVEELYLSGPPDNGAGANVVFWDYAGSLLVTILTFADSVASPGELAEGLHDALAELVAIVDAPTRRPA